MEVSGEIHAPTVLPSGKQTLELMQRKISSLQIWSGRFEEERNLLPMSVIKP
jgi:hypothetical protein